MMNSGMGEEASTQIQVRFITKLSPPLKVAVRSIAVPSNLTRMGLSEIVNHIILSSGMSCFLFHSVVFSVMHGVFGVFFF